MDILNTVINVNSCVMLFFLSFYISLKTRNNAIVEKKIAPNVVYKLFTQAGVGKSMSLVKALFPSCPGYFCTAVSRLPHLTVQICYVVVDIINSA